MNSAKNNPNYNKQRLLFSIVMTLSLLLGACTMRVGGPNKLPDDPAPTTVPLVETVAAAPPAGLTAPQKPISLPSGFFIAVYAEGLQGPRMMTIGPDGMLYVAERGADRIVRLPDMDGDGNADRIEVVGGGLNKPSSLAFFKDGSLYIGETTRIVRLSQPDNNGIFQEQQVIVDGLPAGGHNTRTVLFSRDWQTLFVSVGSSCNICDEEDARRAAIVHYDPNGGNERIYAVGLRNAVGLTLRPGTEELWATNNGRDLLGDDLPPETVYRVEEGGDYGWPRCHSGRISDPEFGGAGACQDVLPPVVEMQAHSAPLGLVFYDGEQFPAEYHGDLFVAFHGSWNRSVPTGYKVVRIPLDGDTAGMVQDFATGWLAGDTSWGRPVDLVVAPDGSLFLSDDAGGFIYRIFYIQ